MSESAVVVGLGQMGGIFAHGLLRCGRTVHPIIRSSDPASVAHDVPEPAIALVAVAEADLDPVLANVPDAWRHRLALLQNELLPIDWERHGVDDPTIAIVWFEKKKEKPLHVVLPTLVAGPRASVLADALEALAIPVKRIEREALLFELVRKNLYILTANIAGLEVGGTVHELWEHHRDLAKDVASEVVALQAFRAGEALPHEQLVAAMAEAFEGDPEHACTGRSAPARLARALEHAREAGISVPTLARIAERHLHRG
jgi:ketopantoate reductase